MLSPTADAYEHDWSVTQEMRVRYSGKTVIVTGGGSGMGACFATRFAAEGARVAILDVDEAGGTRVAEGFADRGRYVRADVTDETGMRDAIGEVAAAWGPIHVAVNNAGVPGARHPLTELPLDIWHRTIAINLTGTFLSMRAEIPAMADGGAIVNLASITGVIAHPNSAAYVATKHAVIGLTKSAALEWGHRGIRINAVAPTWVRTPMTEAVFDDARWAELDAKHALGRVATMDEVAATVAFLGSDEASAITGAVYMVDAGYTAA